ncbi:MAG: ABC transporter ATP-binding protein [Dorea sp.]|jgi:ABC-type multidrug transport system fused ATPase/permease subunit|nr:ABC transporter ATP-binding protein [Clostridiales bacterium]MCI9271488.1 ABC transporter ATP-binding protein [Dorea sp.]
MKKKEFRFFKETKKTLSSLWFMLRLSWRLGKSRFFWTPFTIIIQSLIPILLLTIPKFIIDELTYSQRWGTVLTYIFILAGITAFSALYRWGSWYLQNKSIRRIQLKNEKEYIREVLNTDYRNHENSEYKDLTERVKSNVNVINFLDTTLVEFITNLFQLIGYTYIIARLHWLIIVAIIIIIKVNSVLAEKREKMGYEFQPVVANFARRCQYIYSTMIGFESGKDVRMNNAADWLQGKYKAETENYIKSFNKKQNKEVKITIVDHLINAVQTIIMYGYSAYMAILGKITVGSFSMYLGAITSFIASFTGFISKLINLKYWGYYVDDYRHFLEMSKPDSTACYDKSITEEELSGGAIEFENVSFKYPGTENYVLKDVSLRIEHGEKLSIVGYNGAGKSTFIKLLCRLYAPTTGRITFGGFDIQTIDYSVYRKMLGVVFQDFQLFAFSVKENILLGMEPDEERLNWAIEKSGLSEKVSSLEKGLETSISKEFDENGIEFSGGEGQKLASARAYYRNAPIVILDEPTAALDPIAESKLYERFNSIMENKTAIYISHRLASVKFCDKVAVFEGGHIIEYGTHDALMSQSGTYFNMFTTQAKYYKEDATNEENEEEEE